MIGNKRILAIVPARGGSKGIPKKNLRTINGVSLIAMAGQTIQNVSIIDKAVVSTDDPDIAYAAEKSGLKAPFIRPKNISGDFVSDWSVLVHALMETEKIYQTQYHIILMLQPTSPLRQPTHILRAIEMLESGKWDSVWSVSQTDPKNHPVKQLRLNEDVMDYYDSKAEHIIARQQLSKLFHRNGVVYALTRDCIVNQKSLKGRRAGALVLDGHFVSIDTDWDLQLTEFIINSQINK